MQHLLIDALEIDELAVIPDAQGHNIGAQLLHTILPTTPTSGDQVVVFLAPHHPAAIKDR